MKINYKKIRETRRKKDFSQEYIAFLLGISQSQYCKLESGSKIFEIDTLSKLLDVLEINPLEVIEFSLKQKELMKSFRDLSKEEMRDINGGHSHKRYYLLLR